jgi:hypothetical protein
VPTQLAFGSGVAAGFIAGQLVLASRAGFARALGLFIQPREASDWLPHAVLLALGITILTAHAPRRRRPVAIGLAALLAVAVPARLLAGHFAQQWSMLEKVAHITLLGATLGLVWLVLATARDGEFSRLRQALLVVASVGAAAIIGLSGSFTLGRLCGVVAAALTGTALVSPRGLVGAAGVVAVSLGGLLLLGVYYARLHPATAALVVLSIVAAAGRMPDFISSRPIGQQAAVRSAFALVPLAIGLAMCLA